MANILAMGKQPQVLVFLTGSSATLKSKFFCAEQSIWRQNGYHNMNHSVFAINDISPSAIGIN